MSSLIIRPETPADRDAVYHVEQCAFGREAEAQLVDNLRRDGACLLSLVAEFEGEIIGHVFFAPVTVHGAQQWTIANLGPVAVAPQHQKCGVGSQLICEGLERLCAAGQSAVIVLGHADFYPLFGFLPASRFGIAPPFEVPDEVFMALELRPGALEGVHGTVVYPAAFDAL